MIGREKGAVQRLKEHHPDLLSYHCIIHQSVLCANLGKEYSDVMETIMKLVNYLRASSALQHRLLRAFLTEDDEKMECVAFLVDVTSHLNELNLKLQGRGNTVCDLMSANVQEFSREAQSIFPWANVSSLQTELIDLQENVALKEVDCDPVTFWTKMATAANVPHLQK
ncbi:SCAN domain containing protein 3, partial [Dissostichus eleginoides]